MSDSTIPAGSWELDASHSTISFSVRHMMVAKVRGRFTDFTADIVTKDDPLDSTVQAVVQMSSIDTNDPGRDNHLRTNDFFDIENHPTMSFQSTGVERDGGDFKLHGGVGQDPWGNTKAGFSASGTINRKEFGIEWNAPLETGGVLVGDKVSIELDIEAKLVA